MVYAFDDLCPWPGLLIPCGWSAVSDTFRLALVFLDLGATSLLVWFLFDSNCQRSLHSLRVKQENQSLFHLMELSFLSAEIQAHIEPLFECILKGGC